MSLEITGRLTDILAEQSGKAAASGKEWKKQDFVIETNDAYPKKVCFTAWGDLIDQLNAYPVGSTLNVGFDVASREYNGKWYSDIKAWKIERLETAPGSANAADIPATAIPNFTPSASNDDDLPF